MRRALTTGLALYLGLGGVLTSPVQPQVPLELNNEDISNVEDTTASGSKFQFSSFPRHPSFAAEAFSSIVSFRSGGS